MEIIPGYWVCSCGYFNDEALTWCLECTKKRVEDYIPPSITREYITEPGTFKNNS